MVAGVVKSIAHCSHALCTCVALARMQDVNTQKLGEDERSRRDSLVHLAAPVAVVSVVTCGDMVLSTGVVDTVCEVVLGHPPRLAGANVR